MKYPQFFVSDWEKKVDAIVEELKWIADHPQSPNELDEAVEMRELCDVQEVR